MREFSSSSFSSVTMIVSLLVVILMGSSSAKLSKDFYKKTCPEVFETVNSVVKSAVAKEKRMGASLLRLHFHDCFVQGCDGSILLDNTSSFTSEKTAPPNDGSVRGYEIIDKIKSKVEAVCPGVVSCADIVAIAARDSVVLCILKLGGPYWKVKVGRRDSRSASFQAAIDYLPAFNSTLKILIHKFKVVGLSIKDMVALSGAHTIGLARCTTFRTRIYNETPIDASFAKTRQATCPFPTGKEDNKWAPLDVNTPTFFDNSYFKNLISNKGLLHSDQVLYTGRSTDSLVESYSKNPKAFNHDFVDAIVGTMHTIH